MTMLLHTKLVRPALPAHMVARMRLHETLTDGRVRPLTLVAAPPGWGKTTLVVGWLGHVEAVAWLALDEHDDQLPRFLAYLLAALQTVEPTLGQTAQGILDAAQPLDVSLILATLLNDLAAYNRPLTLVLDDYHLLTARPIHDAVTFLLDHAPTTLHLIILTRHDPPLPLARWRALQRVREVRADALRFTPEEAAQFLNDGMGLALNAEASASLTQRTEGWVAGLQLAALSLRGRDDADAFIERFHGTDRFVADYLLEEVLARQTPDVRLFLVQTSVLQRFNAALCEALLADLLQASGANIDVPQMLIERLDAANVFVVPLDNQRVWYRYHQLFADLLRSRLRREHPDWWPLLHARASEWHEQAGNLDEAMQYALAVRDYSRALVLLDRHAWQRLQHGFVSSVLEWIVPIPEALLLHDPARCVIAALTFVQSWQGARAQRFVDAGERLLADDVLPTSGGVSFAPDELGAYLQACRAFLAQAEGRDADASALAEQALTHLPAHAATARAMLAFLVGYGAYQRGAISTAQTRLREAATALHISNDRFIATTALSMLGTIASERGQFAAALTVFDEALAAGTVSGGTRRLPPAIYPLLNLAWIYYRWNDLDQAKHYLEQAETLAVQGGLYDPLVWVYLLRARRDTTLSLFVPAAAWIAQAAALLEQHPGPAGNYFDLLLARARLALAQGQYAQAEQYMLQCGTPFDAFQAHDIHTVTGFQFFVRHQEFYPTLAHLLVVQQRFAAAHVLLAWLAACAAATQYVVVATQAATLQALAHHAEGRTAMAQRVLAHALDEAAPRNLQRVLLEYGAPLTPLLVQALPQSPHAAFIQTLLAAPELAHDAAPSSPSATLSEPLTERETQTLRLLAVGLNSTEIAEQLILAPSTVRSYIKSVYSKLGVNRRHDAVAKAHEFGLI